MPQLQNLVITDRTPVTPVNLTFVPRDVNRDGIGTVVNNAGTPIGEKLVTVSMKETNNKFRGELRLTLPVVATETINGISAPRVVRTAYVSATFSFEKTSTKQERDDAVGLLASALGVSKTLVNDAIVNLEAVY